MEKISSGCPIDTLLDGGYEKDILTILYGPGGSGKTNVCLAALISVTRQGKKVVFIDTEGGLSLERLKQMEPDYKKTLEKTLLLRPTTFLEQKKAFSKLRDFLKNDGTDSIGIIIVDTVAMLYRLELGKTTDVYDVNRELGVQISYLAEIARKRKIPVVLTTQVYSDVEKNGKINIVGGDILKYQSKCIIELQKLHKGRRKAILRKHRSLSEDKEVVFEIMEKGLVEVD